MHPATRTAVVARFGPAAAGLNWTAVGGGFSGAVVWCGAAGSSPIFALKAWPSDFPTDRLRAAHARVALLSHLTFVPRIQPTREGETVVEADGRAWDLTTWAVGEPERGAPSAARVEAAAAALAAVHAAWRPLAAPPAPAPAVLRRLRALADWDAARPRAPSPGPLDDAVRRAAGLLPRVVPDARAALEPWRRRPVSLQPCLVDVWPEHVRFDGDRVAGLIDFGAIQDDHVGADLARLFAGFPGPDVLPAALAAYRAAGGLLAEPDALVRVLADTGAACAAAAWVARVHLGAPLPAAAAARLHALLDRLR